MSPIARFMPTPQNPQNPHKPTLNCPNCAQFITGCPRIHRQPTFFRHCDIISPVNTVRNWTLWQLADSAFPAGGFAHSGGLEAAWKAGFVPDETALTAALKAVLHQTAHSSLPLLRAVMANPTCFSAANQRAETSLLNHVANHASRAQGQALATAAPRIFPQIAPHLFKTTQNTAYANAAANAPTPLHLAPVYGRVAHALKIDPHDAAALFVFSALRTTLSAAVRLGLTGPLRSQTLLADFAPRATHTLTRAGHTLDDVCTTAPLLDTLQAQQNQLYSRLFQS